MSLRAVNLAKIHIAKTQLGMDDDTYRALLARVAGVRSAKDLGPRQVDQVLVELQRLGWKPKSNRQGRATPKVPQNRQTVLRKITALLASAHRPGATPTTWPGACSRSSGSSGWTTASSTG